MNQSVKLDMPIEFINITPFNPLISRCEIKVCWVGDEPNRNKSIITKEVARKMANSLPGSPIVGYYNEGKEDFEEHSRELVIKNGQIELKDITRPYGFVDLNAKVWFADYQDFDGVVRTYLVTEGWLWTKAYPECQRILEEGNNQSMELDKDLLNAFWTKSDNGKPKFFIVNEAFVEKLCILGNDNEPCFEGSNITTPTIQFSLGDGFKEQLFSMMNELKDLLNKGGAKMFTRYPVTVGDSLWTALYGLAKPNNYSIESVCEEEGQKFAVLKAEDGYYRLNFSLENEVVSSSEEFIKLDDYTPSEEPQFAVEAIEAYEAGLQTEIPAVEEPEVPEAEESETSVETSTEPVPAEPTENSEDNSVQDKPEENENPVNPINYILDEIPEYIELKTNYSALETEHNDLKQQFEALTQEIASLTKFKKGIEKKEKEAMIKSFYMLSDEDKKDVVDNIDNYSIDDIEAKLSIICVRNKVSFNLEEEYSNTPENKPTTYSLNDYENEINAEEDPTVPAWVKAAMAVAKNMN